MSGLGIHPHSSGSSKPLQELPPIPPKEKAPLAPPSTESHLSLAGNQHKSLETFWEGILTFFIKIPFIKNLILFAWKLGLKSTQPTHPIHHPDFLLFNSSIQVPKWFDSTMHQECALTLKTHILAELQMVAEKAPATLHTFARLSQIHISPECYQNELALKRIQKGIKETIHALTQKMQNAHPEEPLQLHLGRHAYENPLEKGPLSGLFIQSFADFLKEHGHETPIRILHIHGPCDRKEALDTLLKSLQNCPTLYQLHLHLDEESSKKVFQSLQEVLTKCSGLEFLVFRNYTGKDQFQVLTKDWDRLTNAVISRKNFNSLSFYDFPLPPETFRSQLQGYVISPIGNPPHGFCIKNPKRLR